MRLQGTVLHVVQTAWVCVGDQSVLEGCTKGLVMRDQATAALQDCVLSGGEIEIHALGGDCRTAAKRVAAHGSEFGAIVKPQGDGVAAMTLVDSCMSGGLASVAVGRHAKDITLLRCTLTDSLTSLHVTPGARLRIKASQVTQYQNGVLVGGSLEQVRQVLVRGVWQPQLAHGSSPGGDTQWECNGAVVMTNVTGSDYSRGCYVTQPYGALEVKHVTVERCSVGFEVHAAEPRTRFVGCRAVACSSPVQAWQWWTADLDLKRVPEGISGIEVVPFLAE